MGRTALHITALYKYHDLADILVKHGANPDIQDIDFNTALDIAQNKRAYPIIALLGGKYEI